MIISCRWPALPFIKRILPILFTGLFGMQAALSQEKAASFQSPYSLWKNGPDAEASFFPIAVWLQDPALAGQYKKAGINTYVGLWKGPTEEQLAVLRKFGMKVICEQNQTGLRHLNDSLIIGWMHGDEPDNAQPLGKDKGYGPPISPATILKEYRRVTAADPTRPVMLNLGQGVAWDGWFGRGTRSNHPEDYPEYMKGGDIISFDIYPVAHSDPAVSGNLWYVAKGVKRLVQWSGGEKIIWNCLECTRIGEESKQASPGEIRAEAWMAIIHGSRGLIYFVHQFKPVFNAHALLDDPVTLQAVTALNNEIARLAPVINSPVMVNDIKVGSSVPIATMMKKYRDTTYLFAVNMRGVSTEASFVFPEGVSYNRIRAINEARKVIAGKESFQDRFKPWEVHLYYLTAD